MAEEPPIGCYIATLLFFPSFVVGKYVSSLESITYSSLSLVPLVPSSTGLIAWGPKALEGLF